MSRIKTFRGKLADASFSTIHLAGGESAEGYRIVKLELMPEEPGGTTSESVVQIFTVPQTVASPTMDFTDDTLLAAAFMATSDSHVYPVKDIVIFDHDVVNQDLYITHQNTGGTTAPVNYYLELEQIKMSKGEEAVVNFKAALLHGE